MFPPMEHLVLTCRNNEISEKNVERQLQKTPSPWLASSQSSFSSLRSPPVGECSDLSTAYSSPVSPFVTFNQPTSPSNSYNLTFPSQKSMRGSSLCPYVFLEDDEDLVSPGVKQPQFNLPNLYLGIMNIFTDTALAASVAPILPGELALDQVHEGAVLAVGAVTASLFGPLCGTLSDSHGWSKVLIWYYPLAALSSAILIVAHRSFWIFVIARLIAGVGSGVMYPSNFSMIVAVHDNSLRSTAVGLSLVGDIGSLLGPFFGGILYDIGGVSLLYSVILVLILMNTLLFFIATKSTSRKISFHHQIDLDPYSAAAPPPKIRLTSTRSLHAAPEVARHLTSKPYGHSSSSAAIFVPSVSTSASVLYPAKPHVRHPVVIDDLRSEEPKELQVIPTNLSDSVLRNLKKLNVFFSLQFATCFFALFYCWGVAISLLAVLPIIWNNSWHLTASSIGLLFIPHLVCRIAFSALSPLVCQAIGVPLHSLISGGLFIAVVATAVLALTPNATPIIHCFILAAFGQGHGIVDSCVTAWAGNFETTSKGDGVFHGRAFAVMALACDCGMFTLPLFASFMSQNISFSFSYSVLAGFGFCIFGLSLYCNF